MSEAAESPQALEAAAVSPAGDSAVSLNRKAEGGLSLQFSFDLPKLPSVAKVGSWSHQQLINGALIVAVVALVAWIVYQERFAPADAAPPGFGRKTQHEGRFIDRPPISSPRPRD